MKTTLMYHRLNHKTGERFTSSFTYECGSALALAMHLSILNDFNKSNLGEYTYWYE